MEVGEWFVPDSPSPFETSLDKLGTPQDVRLGVAFTRVSALKTRS
jgi:hypothetical protein